jgi:hypothetical protein
MNKRLLLSFAAIMGAMTSFAYNVGDYVYTHDAKFKVVGDNLIANGNFASNYDGWKDYADGALSPDYWSIETGAAEDGKGNVIQSANGGADLTGNYMYQAVPFESGKTYVVTFKMKGVEPGTSSITQKTSNYVDVFANADGTVSKTADRFQQVATTDALNAEWTSYSFSFTDTVTGGSTGYIVVSFGQLTQGTQISDVEIREVESVFDTRISDKEIAYAKSLLAIEDFKNGRDEFSGTIESVEGFFKTPASDDPSGAAEAINSFVLAENAFLDANSYDVSSMINSKQLWRTKMQKANGTYGDWYVEGSTRWYHDPSSDPYIRDYMPGFYSLNAGTAKIVKKMPAGKYFFSCESKGHRMAGTSKATQNVPDYTWTVEGCKVFVGKDSVAFNLDQRNFERHFVMSTVADGDTLNAGFWHPALTQSLGGQIYVQNPVLRIVGDNSNGEMKTYVENYVALNAVATQANALKVMLDSAVVVSAKAEYPWGKAELNDTTTKYQTVYSELSVLKPGAELFDVAADSLEQSMRIVRSAINAYYSLNAPYTDLKAQIAQANESINLPANANGDKATFKTVIDKAQGLINSATAEYNEELAQQMKDAKTELVDAQSAFEATTAAFNNPSELQIVNPFFEGAGKYKIPTGWNGVMDENSNAKWKGGSDKNYENGTYVCSWKGYTYFPKNSLAQQVNVLKSGVYVLSCQTICYNERGSYDGDRNTYSGVFYYGKLAESADTIAAHMIHTNRNVGYYPEIYAVVYDKADEAETSLEFGYNALNNTCCNQYTFGGNHLRYMGPKAKFDTDLAAALAASLENGAAMYQSIASFENDATVEPNTKLTYGNIYINLGHAVDYAQVAETSSQKMTAYYQLQDAIKNANVVVAGVKGIIAEPVAKIQKGVYTLTGVKVADNAANLPQGLYIVNGKKVIVK